MADTALNQTLNWLIHNYSTRRVGILTQHAKPLLTEQ